MSSAAVLEIEEKIQHLRLEDQLWIIERTAHRLRGTPQESAVSEPSWLQSQLTAMSHDPEVQAELRAIERESAPTTQMD